MPTTRDKRSDLLHITFQRGLFVIDNRALTLYSAVGLKYCCPTEI